MLKYRMASVIRTTYKKRGGTSGAGTHFMEINLLTWFKLQGDKKLKDFYLAGNLEAAGAFDDVVFRYTDENDEQKVIFLQAISKESKKYKLTIDSLRKGGNLDLQKYFHSFLKIQTEFQNSQKGNPIFQGNSYNLHCSYVIYTNAMRDESLVEYVNDLESSPLSAVLPEKYGHAFRLKLDVAKNLLDKVLHEIEINHVMELVKRILSSHGDNMRRDENFKMYHAFFAYSVFAKHGSDWKIREEFLDGVFENESLSKFRERMLDWYTVEFMNFAKRKMQKHDFDGNKKQMKDWNLKLPDWFGNKTLKFDEELCEQFTQIAYQCIDGEICVIKHLTKQLMKFVVKLVGNVFVLDTDGAVFKLNEQKLDGESGRVLEYLTCKLNITGLKFVFQIENFPKLSLGCTAIDSKELMDFSSKFNILTGQPDASDLHEMIKRFSFSNVSEMEATRRFHAVRGKITAWWKQSHDPSYLTKNDGFCNEILEGITFDLKAPSNSFTGRKKELNSLHDALWNSDNCGFRVISKMVSVSGLGGIGKSELARQYANEYKDFYDGNVIWINADNRESMVYCFRRLCKDSLNISTRDANDKEKDTTSIVQEVYSFFQNRRSLFIFDNANRFKNGDDRNDAIEPFLPSTKTGITIPHFIITSRNQRWPRTVLKLNVFEDYEAEQLVKCKLGIKDGEQDVYIKQLIKELQNFPLALQQAIEYIRETDRMNHRTRGTHFTLQDYLLLLTEKTEELFGYKFPADFPDHYTKTTLMTWNITLAEIEKHELGQEAKKLLNIMAFLSPSGIPITFFMESVHGTKDKLPQVVNLLSDYSIINLHEGVADILRLVQWVVRLKLNDVEKKVVLKAGLELVNVHTDKKLINVGASLWDNACNYDDLVSEFRNVPSKVIEALRDSVRYEEAYAFGEKSLESLQRVLGNEHIGALTAQYALAHVMNDIGKYASALIEFRYIFDIYKRDLGTDHTLTLGAQHSIALTLHYQGKYEEALASYKEVFEKQIKILGPDNPYTLTTQHNIADTLSQLGKYDEALASFKEVLEKEMEILGPCHPDTVNAQYSIARTLSSQGKYKEALASLKEVCEKRNEILGLNHPLTLTTKYSIAQTLHSQGRYDEALVTYKGVFEKQMKILGPDHPSTLATESNITLLLSKQGKL